MATLFSGTIVTGTFTGNTKQAIINGIQTVLTSAGWTVVSGGTSTNLLMQTVITPAGQGALQARFRFKDNAGTCCTISLENTAGTVLGSNNTTNGIHLLPGASRVFEVIANPYQFVVFVPGEFNIARDFAMGGVNAIVGPLTGITAAGFLKGNSVSDSSTTIPFNWRNNIGIAQNQVPNFQAMWNASLLDNANNTQNSANAAGCIELWVTVPACVGLVGGLTTTNNLIAYRWANGDNFSSDPLISWALTLISDEPLVRGQLWDSIVIHDSVVGDTTASFSGHNWINITNSESGGGVSSAQGRPRGSLWIAIS